MPANKTKLGRGLEAIFGDDLTQALNDIQNDESNERFEIPLSEIRINPYQPRQEFNKEKLEELAQSIREHGVFTPVLVRKSLNGYELIAGERRLRASQMAGKDSIPAILLDLDDAAMMQITLLENVQREDLNPIEEANGYYTILTNLNYTQEELAKKLGKSRSYIANLLRLRRLPQEVQDMVMENRLSGSHVRTLLSLENDEEITKWARRCLQENLSVHDLERLLKKREEKKKPAPEKKKDIFLESLRNRMIGKLQTGVEIKKHKLIIDFEDTQDLNRILDILGITEEE